MQRSCQSEGQRRNDDLFPKRWTEQQLTDSAFRTLCLEHNGKQSARPWCLSFLSPQKKESYKKGGTLLEKKAPSVSPYQLGESSVERSSTETLERPKKHKGISDMQGKSYFSYVEKGECAAQVLEAVPLNYGQNCVRY